MLLLSDIVHLLVDVGELPRSMRSFLKSCLESSRASGARSFVSTVNQYSDVFGRPAMLKHRAVV